MNVKLDTAPFNRYAGELARKLGRTLPNTIRPEAASVIKIAASMEAIAKVEKIKQDVAERSLRRIADGSDVLTINVTARGRTPRGTMWFSDGEDVKTKNRRTGQDNRGQRRWFYLGYTNLGSATFTASKFRLPDRAWNQANALFKTAKEKNKAELAAALKARGLTMQSWVQILEAIPGQTLENTAPKSAKVPALVKNAVGRKGPRRAGFAGETMAANSYLLETFNTAPIAVKRGGQQKLEAGIRIRAAAFNKACEHHLFDNAKSVASHYPGVEVKAA